MSLLVYIAGPYQGLTKGHSPDAYIEIEDNINKARYVAAWCAMNGLGFYCPHLNSAHFEVFTPNLSPEFWYEMYLKFLNICDALLVQGKWELSKGTLGEIEMAKKWNKPVFFFDDEEDKHKLLSMKGI